LDFCGFGNENKKNKFNNLRKRFKMTLLEIKTNLTQGVLK